MSLMIDAHFKNCCGCEGAQWSPFSTRNISRPHRLAGQAGLTLVELLVALAVSAIALLALFQSVAGWLTVTETSNRAVLRATSQAVFIEQFDALVGGIAPGWPEENDGVFRGDANGFQALTKNALHTDNLGLWPVSLRITANGTNAYIAYGAPDTSWALQALDTSNARFFYLGPDGVWYNRWPLQEASTRAATADQFSSSRDFFEKHLPRAIKLEADVRGTRTALIAKINRDNPTRIRNLDAFNIQRDDRRWRRE